MNGYKTFIAAMAMLIGSFVLIVMKIMPATDWWTIVAAVSGMMGLREVGDKLLKPLGAGERRVDQ